MLYSTLTIVSKFPIILVLYNRWTLSASFPIALEAFPEENQNVSLIMDFHKNY